MKAVSADVLMVTLAKIVQQVLLLLVSQHRRPPSLALRRRHLCPLAGCATNHRTLHRGVFLPLATDKLCCSGLEEVRQLALWLNIRFRLP